MLDGKSLTALRILLPLACMPSVHMLTQVGGRFAEKGLERISVILLLMPEGPDRSATISFFNISTFCFLFVGRFH